MAMLFFFKPHKDAEATSAPFLDKVLGLDIIGNLILIAAAIMLFLALEFNASDIPWQNSKIVGLLVGAGLTAVVFVFWQVRQGDKALLPPRIIRQRSVAASCLAAFFMYGAILVHCYYLPIWFQAIKGANAVQSGIDLIAYMAANAAFSVFAGLLVSKLGYFTPPAIIGAAIGTVGCGLFSTLEVNSGPAKWVGYQVLTSVGLGMAVQQGVIAVQTVLRLDQVPIGIAAIISMQSLGGSVFVSAGNSILQNSLNKAAADNMLPGVNIHQVLARGATEFRKFVPKEALPGLIEVYNSALQKVFILAVPLAGLSFVFALALEWKSVKEKTPSLEAMLGPATTQFFSVGESVYRTMHRDSVSRESETRGSFETARTSLESVDRLTTQQGGGAPAVNMLDLRKPARTYQDPRMARQASLPGSWHEA